MSASVNSTLSGSDPSIRPRNAAMRHDRDRGDERRDRGRSGRDELDPPRSVSPHARRRRHDDRDAADDRTESKYRSDRSRKHREHSSRHSSRRSRSRDGRYRDRSPSRRYSEDRGRPRPDLSPRRSPRRRGYADDEAFDDTSLGSKRLRSRSPSPSGSYRKKSRRDHSDRHSDRKRTSHRSQERHRSPRHRPRPDDRIGRDSASVSDPYDRAGSEARSLVGDGGAQDFPSRNARGTAEFDTRNRDSRVGSRRSSPTRNLSPRSTYPPHNRRETSRSPGSRGLPGRDLRSPDPGRRHPSPEGRHRSGRERSRERGFSKNDTAVTGANSVDVNMGSRTSHFQGGHPSQHSSFTHKTQYGAESRHSYSQSPTPNSSYHNSPISQSSHLGGRSGWNGQQQFSPSQQQPPSRYAQQPAAGSASSAFGRHPNGPQGPLHPSSNHSPPQSAPTGPMNQYPGGHRGGFRGTSGSYRGSQLNSGRGGHRGPGFKSAQWTSGGQPEPDEEPAAPASSSVDVQPHEEERRSGTSNPFRPSKDLQVNDAHFEQQERHPQQPRGAPTEPSATTDPEGAPPRAAPTGPSSSKFSFAFKPSSKQPATAPKPEISQKFNAAPKPPPTQPRSQTQNVPKDRGWDHDRERDRNREWDRERDRNRDRERERDRDRDPLRSAPTEPASARAARRHQEPPPPRQPRTRIVKKKMRRLIERPKLEPAMAVSKSVFFRKPGNESVVGSGTYGKVFKGLHVYTNKSVALKRIRMEGERDGFPVTAVREVKLLQSLRHLNIVNLMEVMVEKNDCFMVFEYLAYDLTGILNHPSFKLDNAQRKDMSRQLFEGLDYLHGRGVLHRDIKAANILVSKEGILKLADFGLARFYAKRHQLDYTNRVVTIWYRSPELLLGETQYGPACDIWSAACVMMEIFARSAIFPGNGTEMGQLERIYAVMGTPTLEEWPGILDMAWFELLRPTVKVKRTFEDKYKEQLSPAAFELLALMFLYDPAKRPTAGEVLAHWYFTEEAPPARQAVELGDLRGDWHELESKALRRENERKEKEEKEARRAKEQGVPGKERERKRAPEENQGHRETKRPHTERDISEPS